MSGHPSQGEKRTGDEASGEPRGTLIPQKRICLVVLGMHRSGTSALTRVLSILGAKLPATLNLTDSGNETGYWESDPLIHYHDALLAELGSSWRDWQSLDWSRVPMRRRAEIKTEIAGIIDAEFSGATPIVVKEPRLCRFAPLFFDAAEETGAEVRCVLPIRSPLEVIDSLVRRDGMERGHAALLWLRHVLDAEIATRSRPRVFLSYDALLTDWRKTIAHVTDQLSMRWKYALTDVESLIDEFLSDARRHHKSSMEEVLLDPLLRTWMGETYAALLVLERNPQSEAALETLDTIRNTFNGAAPIIQRLLLEARTRHDAALAEARDAAAADRVLSEQRALDEANAAARRLQDAQLAGKQELAALSEATTQRAIAVAGEAARQLAGAHEEANRRVAEAEKAAELRIDEERAAFDGREAELNTRFAQIERELDESRAEATNLSVRLEQATEDAAGAGAALAELSATLDLARTQLRETATTLLTTQEDLRRRIGMNAFLHGQLDELRAANARLALDLSAEREAKNALQGALVERDSALKAAASELARRDARLRAATATAQAQEDRLRAASADLREGRDRIDTLDRDLQRSLAEAESLRGEVSARDIHLNAMGTSTSWRITRPIRGVKRLFTDPEFRRQLPTRLFGARSSGQPLRRWTLPWARHVADRLMSDHGYRANALRKTGRVLRGQYGEAPRTEVLAPIVPQQSAEPARGKVGPLEPYQAWLRANRFTDADRAELRDALALRAARLPKLSAVMPVYNSDPRLLREIVECVRGQVYENWELCLVDDCSPAAHVRPLLQELARSDKRIKVQYRRLNGGIAECTNTAVAMADGEVVVFIDHDDLITPDCFAELALYYADHQDADIVYSDDDKVDMNGVRSAPQFKPDYAPTLLLSFMYIGHVFSVRRALFNELGGFRKAFDGSQDYDFALRAVERARRVGHIPKVLYSWRIAPGSTAASADAKPESFEAGRKAVEEALVRRGARGNAMHPEWARKAKCGIFAVEFPDTGPSVTLIIPTRNKVELLRACVESLAKTTYRNYQIMVVDNESSEPEALAYLAELRKRANVRVESIGNDGRPFSYARINNEAVRRANTDFVLLLNNDTEVREPRWLSQMIGHAQLQGVGAVGAKLLFGDGTIQHAGIVHGLYDGMAGPAFRNRDCHDWGYLNFLKVSREFSAVTAACLLVSKALYERLGGLDEQRFNVAYNDVDFCYRIVDQGLSCVYCADAELFHYEGKSRGHRDNPREVAAFRSLYKGRVDPWYNANLSLEDEQFRIRGARQIRRSKAPVRAVMVSHNLEHEGAPNSMMELVSGLKRRGFIDPVVLSPLDGPLRRHYEGAGIDVQIVRNPLTDVHDEPSFAAAMEAFARTLKHHSAEVVYGNTLQTFWAMTGAAAAGLPAIWNPRESEPPHNYFDYLTPALRPHAYGAFASAYATVFVAHATRNNWRELNSKHNFRVIHNGISMERLSARAAGWTRAGARERLDLSASEVSVTLVGTVCDRKGQVDLIEAIRQLPQEAVARAKFQIVGDRAGPYSEALHAAAATLPAERRKRLSIVGETDDPYLYFRAADIALCTSRIESYPRVILEAMACGLPIITTSVFGIAEQVREEVNALFYSPHQTDVLARHLDRLIRDDGVRIRMSNESPHVLQCLTQFDEMIEAYGLVFHEAAGSPVGVMQ